MQIALAGGWKYSESAAIASLFNNASRGQIPGAVKNISTEAVLLSVFLWDCCQLQIFYFIFFPSGAVDQISGRQQLPFEDSSDLLKEGGHPKKPAAAQAARGTQVLQSKAGCCISSQAGVRKGQKESRRSQCLSVSNHADKNLTTPSAQQKFLSPSIYPYNITIRASGHLLSLSKQKSSLKTLVMQVMAWNHPFSRKMVILHLESKEGWLGVQSYYFSHIQSPLVIREQLTYQSTRVFIQCRYKTHWSCTWIFLWVLLAHVMEG